MEADAAATGQTRTVTLCSYFRLGFTSRLSTSPAGRSSPLQANPFLREHALSTK